MRFSNITADLHSVVNWAQMEDLRQIKLLGDRSIEVLKGIRAAGVDDYISCTEIHRVMEIHAGKKYASTSSNIKAALQKCGNRVEKQLVAGRLRFRFPMTKAPSVDLVTEQDVDCKLLSICERFHRSVSHLSSRRKGKTGISFSDEYDVQDVFGTVLKCLYDDVRDEEWFPSYAGSAGRVDFVIIDSQTAVEIKRARDRQGVADELILDIAHYNNRPDVQKLVCFVYDPEGHLRRDAVQIEKDLSGTHKYGNRTLDVIVLIRPK